MNGFSRKELGVVAIISVLMYGCGGPSGAERCQPVVEQLIPAAQEVIDTIDSEERDAFDEASSRFADIRELAIESECPPETLRSMLAEQADSLTADTDQGQSALDDLVSNGPFQYQLGEDVEAVASTTTTTASTTTTTTAPTTTVPVAPELLCGLDVEEPLTGILGSAPEGEPGEARSMDFDTCVWEVPEAGVVAVAFMLEGQVLPEDTPERFAEFGLQSSDHASTFASINTPADGPSTVVLIGLIEPGERDFEIEVDVLHSAVRTMLP